MNFNMSLFNFDNTYIKLPELFYKKVLPAQSDAPSLIVFNQELAQNLGLKEMKEEDLALYLSGKEILPNSKPLAQAYAGHQFGHFTMLGDGRAILLGEHITPSGERFDVQLKGAGQTPFSRRGDGKATLKSMLREYLFSEALFGLKIPSSRSLAVVKTGEKVYREDVNDGGVLTRIMKSHIRVGTFEYARYFQGNEALETLLNYTIDRHFPEIKNSDNKAISLLDKVMHLQIDLVANWMRVGFIHGVMNTDNVSINGETFDYGPCAFMNTYHPDTVFSSIDTQGRYAYSNQPKILKWNLAKLAEALLPLINENQEKAVELAVKKVNEYDQAFTQKWYATMCAKIGIENPEKEDEILVDSLFKLMQNNQLDFTNTFIYLSDEAIVEEEFKKIADLQTWKKDWIERLNTKNIDFENAKQLMRKYNPIFVARNNHVEEALDKAIQNDFSLFNNLLEAFKNPFQYNEKFKDFLQADSNYDKQYQTFCGT